MSIFKSKYIVLVILGVLAASQAALEGEYFLLVVFVCIIGRGAIKAYPSLVREDIQDRYDQWIAPQLRRYRLGYVLPIVAVATWFGLLKCSGHAVGLTEMLEFIGVAAFGWAMSKVAFVFTNFFTRILDPTCATWPLGALQTLRFSCGAESSTDLFLRVPHSPPRFRLAHREARFSFVSAQIV